MLKISTYLVDIMRVKIAESENQPTLIIHTSKLQPDLTLKLYRPGSRLTPGLPTEKSLKQ